MAISKILHMKDSGNSFHARHLKRALDYVMNPEKTQRGRLVGAINCQADMAFEQMMDTKKQFGKTDKGMPYIMPKTSSKKFRQKIRDIKVWLYANRDQPLKKLMGMLNLKLIGHYRYYGISFNGRMISNYKQQVRELLFKVLNRRSDRKSYTREGFIEMLKYYPLAMPKIYVSLF